MRNFQLTDNGEINNFVNGVLTNHNYDEEKIVPLSSNDIEDIKERHRLYGSVGDCQFEWDLIIDLMEEYNLKDEDEIWKLI